MSSAAIEVTDLGKRYRIGAKQHRSDSLRDAVAAGVRRLLRKERMEREHFWALRHASFEVRHGEVVGVIGRNGAGKSTFLKLLSRITEPTEGMARIYGRVGSLLEVGTGFHQELTGRENIYLNGAILGMDKEYIDRRFDEIVEFSEVEKFLDTPVKRYSSGMYLRLAFAVAAHLESDVLIVDEVLAVGDAEFQRKCLGKMGEVTKQGRTVLFVSHNMAAVQGLCQRAIFLERGRVKSIGPTTEVIEDYLSSSGGILNTVECDLREHPKRRPGSSPVLQSVELSLDGRSSPVLPMGRPVSFVVRFKGEGGIPNMRFGIAIEDVYGQRVCIFTPTTQAPDLFNSRESEGIICCDVPSLPLLPGTYHVTLILSSKSKDYIDRIDQAISFSVESADVFGNGVTPGATQGVFYAPAVWTVERESVSREMDVNGLNQAGGM